MRARLPTNTQSRRAACVPRPVLSLRNERHVCADDAINAWTVAAMQEPRPLPAANVANRPARDSWDSRAPEEKKEGVKKNAM